MSKFSRDTAVQQAGENLWRGELCEGWRIGEVPSGGYVLAVVGRALSEALAHSDPLTVTGFYLAPPCSDRSIATSSCCARGAPPASPK